MTPKTEQPDMRSAAPVVLASAAIGAVVWYFAIIGIAHTYQNWSDPAYEVQSE